MRRPARERLHPHPRMSPEPTPSMPPSNEHTHPAPGGGTHAIDPRGAAAQGPSAFDIALNPLRFGDPLRWIAAGWPFASPRFVGRDLTWPDWLALPDVGA